MIAGKYNITAYKNRDYSQVFTFDIDITSKVFAGAVDNAGSDVNFTITNVDANNILVEMLDATIDNFDVGTYNYDIKMDNTQIIEGKFNVKPTITE